MFETTMNKRILVGIDMELSSPIQHALHVVSEFLEQPSPYLQVVLFTVIPTLDTSFTRGGYRAPFIYLGSTTQQRLQADRALRRACLVLTQRGVARDRIELLRREGAPADEIVKVAQELGVDCIVLGSHENSLAQKIRRIVAGSTSRQVLQHAPCPIIIVALARTLPSHDLVVWYEEAVTHYLHEQAGRLTILTSREVARSFGPDYRTAGRKEVVAATRALERLASNGVLCCRRVKGELHCMND
jgi:nucleotide-binding universal stress UspA family protein